MSIQKIALVTAVDKNHWFQTSAINLGLLSLEAYLSKHTNIQTSPVENLKDVLAIRPDIVGISAVTENYGRAIEMARQIKANLKIPVIIGGVHISSLPESLDPVFDAGIIGEGEETLLELVRLYPDIKNIFGTVTWKDKKLHINPRRKPIANLDIIPPPNRGKWVERLGMATIMTTRGCLFKCSFCSSPVVWQGCRRFSPEYVMAELKDIADNFHPKFIRFFDDILTLDKKRLKQIVDLICEGLDEEIVFACFSRVNMMDEEIVELLVKGNILFVSVGIESASDAVTSRLKDSYSPIKKSQKIIDMAAKAGLYISCSIIIGSPTETEDDLIATYDFLERNADKLFDVEINPLVPHPGTPVWDYAKKRGLVDNPMDWGRLQDHSIFTVFNPEKYLYLNENMPYETFLKYVEKFMQYYQKVSLGKDKIDIIRKYFKPGDLPAKLKEPGQSF